MFMHVKYDTNNAVGGATMVFDEDEITSCVEKCPPGFYGDFDNNPATTDFCKECLTDCTNCTTNANCFRCKPGLKLSANTCIASCPVGEFNDENDIC